MSSKPHKGIFVANPEKSAAKIGNGYKEKDERHKEKVQYSLVVVPNL